MFSCIEVLCPIVGRKKRAEHAKQLPKRFSLDVLVREDDVDNCYPFIFPQPMTTLFSVFECVFTFVFFSNRRVEWKSSI